jgi:1-acyl-sn-glycerol-3-phosphate acyltransferase
MSQFEIFKAKKFAPLFWTQFFGAFNDNFLKNALVILVTFRSLSVLGLPASEIVALAGGIFILPFFLFSALAGQIADKYEKGRIIHWIKGVEILIMLLALYGLMTDQAGFLLAVLFLMGLHSTFFGPIKYSILPQHLHETELVAGNALIEAGTFLAILIGTIAGGLLIALPHGGLIVGTGLITLAITGFITSLFIPQAPAAQPELKLQFNPVGPTLKMFSFARQTQSVFLSILGISWFWFYGAALLSVFAPLCKDVLHAGETVVTLFLAIFSIGIGLGSLLCERFSRKRLELGLVPLGSIGISIFGVGLWGLCRNYSTPLASQGVLDFLKSASGIAITMDLLLLSMFSGFFIVPMYTLMQEKSDPAQRSRVIAANNVLNALFMVVSSLLLILFLHFGWSIPQIILTLSLANIFVAGYIYALLPEFLLRFLMWILANILYRVRVSGEDNMPLRGGALLVCNHVSFIDWLLLSAAVRRPLRFVMHYGFFRGFPIRQLMRQAKVIPIATAKEDPVVLEAAFEQIAEELRNGHVVCIFPEGKITFDGELSPFHPGITRILDLTPVPVIPAALNGLWGSLFSRKDLNLLSKRPRKLWAKIEIRIGAPLKPEQSSLEVLRNQIEGLLEAGESK